MPFILWGHDPNGLDGQFGSGVKNAVTAFQSFVGLDADGIVGKQTWASLMVSYGDKNRTVTACDCATILTDAKAKTLYNAGYRYVGRYLCGVIANGDSKALTKEELQIIYNNGLRVFPIHQKSGNYLEYFTYDKGKSDAKEAADEAWNLGIPMNSVIYFAVDFDATDAQVSSNILKYFRGVYEHLSVRYRVGIYGARNVCSRVLNAGYAVNSFVCDMSSGFSGNMGYPLPQNWAFDQIATVTVGSGDGQIEIDKDVCKGTDLGADSVYISNNFENNIPSIAENSNANFRGRVNLSEQTIPIYSEIHTIEDTGIYSLSNPIDDVIDGKVSFSAIGYTSPNYTSENDLNPDDMYTALGTTRTVYKIFYAREDGKTIEGFIFDVNDVEDFVDYGIENGEYVKHNSQIIPYFDEYTDENGFGNYYYFTLTCELNCYDENGDFTGTLPSGTKIATDRNGLCLKDYPWLIEIKYKKIDNNHWIPAAAPNTEGTYVPADNFANLKSTYGDIKIYIPYNTHGVKPENRDIV